ncbi:MAG: alpha/beta hydrolase [Paracoccaceae bacterium]
MKYIYIRLLGIALALLVLQGCIPQNVNLAAPPNLYATGTNFPAEQVSIPLRTISPNIFFMTDRLVETDTQGGFSYGLERSEAMVFGVADVQFGATDWDDLVDRTYVDRGGRISRLDVEAVREIVRFSEVPLGTRRANGALVFDPQEEDTYEAQGRAFQAAIQEEIRRTGNKRVLVFAHGVGNGFEKSITTLANLWHFAGRETIPIVFSWPAGNSGLLGYFRDREAGDFSVFHAKELLRLLADIPEIDDIDIVAHSRGTDVMTKALREQVIFYRGAGLPPKRAMKTGTLILAAADLDTGVVRQRLRAERFAEAFEQINIYINPGDGALQLSSFITAVPRLGAATSETLDRGELEHLKKEELIHFIRVENVRGGSHSYFRDNPAVLSDIVLALRTRAFPGGTLRPLEVGEDGFWQLHPNYPLERLPDLAGLKELGSER